MRPLGRFFTFPETVHFCQQCDRSLISTPLKGYPFREFWNKTISFSTLLGSFGIKLFRHIFSIHRSKNFLILKKSRQNPNVALTFLHTSRVYGKGIKRGDNRGWSYHVNNIDYMDVIVY